MIFTLILALELAFLQASVTPVDPVVTEGVVGAPVSEVWRAMKMREFFEKGNRATFDSLARRFASH